MLADISTNRSFRKCCLLLRSFCSSALCQLLLYRINQKMGVAFVSFCESFASMSVHNGLNVVNTLFYSISSGMYVVRRFSCLLTFCLMRIWREYILPLRLPLCQPYSFHLLNLSILIDTFCSNKLKRQSSSFDSIACA